MKNCTQDDLKKLLELLNVATCGRCGTNDKIDAQNRLCHSSGQFLDFVKNFARANYSKLKSSLISDGLIQASVWLKSCDEGQFEKIRLSILNGGAESLDLLRMVFEGKVHDCENQLERGLRLVLDYSNEPWAKHSPEMGFVFDAKHYPKYKDERPIAVEVCHLHSPSCILHGDDRLFMMGLIPVKMLKEKVSFSISEIPENWGMDHPYFKYQEHKSLGIDDWLFCYRHRGKPEKFKPHMPREMECLFGTIWDFDLIFLLAKFSNKLNSLISCFQ